MRTQTDTITEDVMKQTSSQTVKLLNEERALLMSLAAKRDASYSDVLRLGLYQLATLDGLHGTCQ